MIFTKAEIMHNCFENNSINNYICIVADIENLNVLSKFFLIFFILFKIIFKALKKIKKKLFILNI